jgi:hypothetical protein
VPPGPPLLTLSEAGGGVEVSEVARGTALQYATGMARHHPGTAWLTRKKHRRVSRVADLAPMPMDVAPMLHSAQAEPEAHRDLVVRVVGTSATSCDLSRALQDEIIARTEHESFEVTT